MANSLIAPLQLAENDAEETQCRLDSLLCELEETKARHQREREHEAQLALQHAQMKASLVEYREKGRVVGHECDEQHERIMKEQAQMQRSVPTSF